MDTNVDFLHKTVWCTVAPSKISGVGVFAIRDIPKGTELTDYFLQDRLEGKEYGTLTLSVDQFKTIMPEIKDLILDRICLDAYSNEHWITFLSPNWDLLLQAFMNHSREPNSDGEFTLRDIKKGEEITEDFRTLTATMHKVSKKHYNFL